MNVLVVEDNPDIGTLLSVWLSDTADVRIRVDSGGVTSADIAWADAVIADFSLPTSDGCAVLARVEAERPAARRIMWTAIADAHCDHAQFVIVKPVTLLELRAVLDGR